MKVAESNGLVVSANMHLVSPTGTATVVIGKMSAAAVAIGASSTTLGPATRKVRSLSVQLTAALVMVSSVLMKLTSAAAAMASLLMGDDLDQRSNCGAPSGKVIFAVRMIGGATRPVSSAV